MPLPFLTAARDGAPATPAAEPLPHEDAPLGPRAHRPGSWQVGGAALLLLLAAYLLFSALIIVLAGSLLVGGVCVAVAAVVIAAALRLVRKGIRPSGRGQRADSPA
ncbi:hypothetical protein ACWCZ5_20965 [Streptomyces sp. NPDC001667]